MDGKAFSVKAGSVAYIESGKVHHFENTGKAPLKFICLVPPEGDKY
jgi:mannose-6-phosphate isomerase-like protein (cupin superfamily)